MSASHQYFYPCKDLLSPEERKQLQHLGGEIVKVIRKDKHFLTDIQLQNRDYFNEIIGAGKFFHIIVFNHGDNKIRACDIEVLNSHVPEIQVYKDLMDKITERYSGGSWRLAVCLDDSIEGKIHKDPKFNGFVDTNCNIPLSPDYAFYRPTYFYKEEDPETLETIARYSRFRSPALLNLQKYHSIGGGDGVVPKSEHKAGIYAGRSFALQIVYKEPYPKVVQMFKKKRWLTTTPF